MAEARLTDESGHAFMEGVRAFCTGDYAGARRRFENALAADPRNDAVLAACGHAHLHLGEPGKALDFYRRAAACGCETAEVQYNRALIAMREGRHAEALGLLGLLYESAPEVAAGAFYFGLFFNSTAELLADVAIYIAGIHRDFGNLREAKRWYLSAAEQHPRSVTAQQKLAELAVLSKSWIEAINHLRRVLELSPLEEDIIGAHNNLGIALYENGELDEAVEHLTMVLRRAPGNPPAIHNLNHIYEREGVFQRGEKLSSALRFMDVREAALPIFELSGGRGSAPQAINIVGRSQEMMRVMRHARLAAASESPALIQGEPGTGKKLLGRLIALNSSRREGPFGAIECDGMPEHTLDSELFGFEKGAFTGARARKAGALESNAGGTLYLQEVAALTPMLQSKLFRALQDRQFLPLGGTRPVPVQVRLIASSRRDLAEMVRQGQFREDLYYALNVVPIQVPALRERREDVPVLAEYFLGKYSRGGQAAPLGREDVEVLKAHDWPGNVRELENLIQRAVVVGTQSSLYLEELGRLRRARTAEQRRSRNERSEAVYPLDISLEELEKRHILAVLRNTGNNQKTASSVLGINPSTLWRKLKGYGVEAQGDEREV